MSPKPGDISCFEALQNPNKNRSNKYLPGMSYTDKLCCVNSKMLTQVMLVELF